MSDSQKFYKGWVTHVIDPSSFWMQIGSDNGFDLFRVYQASIDDYFNTHGGDLVVPASSLSQGDCVAVKKYSDHEQFKWRRAQVSRVEGDTVDVFYVDYGYAEILNMDDIRLINRHFFEYLAPQAIRVGLAGIQPLTRSWTSRAVSAFEERVLHKSVIVNILEMDESQSLFVALYRRGDDGDWYSVSHGMLEDDLGLPNDYTLGFEKCISHDAVERALLLMNVEESADSPEEVQEEVYDFSIEREENQAVKEVWEDAIEKLEESSSEDEAAEVKANGDESNNATGFVGDEGAANQILKPEKREETLLLKPPDSIDGASGPVSQDEVDNVGIPQFNIKPLHQTKTVSANELQVKVERQTQRKTLKALQNDLHNCAEDLDEGLVPSTNFHWGRSDSQVGEPHYADDSDLQESISEELYNRFLGGVDEIKALRQTLSQKSHDLKKKLGETPEFHISQAAQASESSASQLQYPSTACERQPLTEKERYHMEVKIIEILKNKKNETPEMMRVQIHEIVPADESIPHDLLAAVITSVLESIIYHKCFDPAVALTILETYTGADLFIAVIIDTLKSLKDKLVKVPKNKQKCNHEDFASLLAMLFIQSQCWSISICKAVQNYSLSIVEKWIIFNKKRQQDQETVINTELTYLDCVYIFMRQTGTILSDLFPEHIHNWLDEIREKLLHDLTERCLRVRLLDILLDNIKDSSRSEGSCMLRPSSTSVGTQTGRGNLDKPDTTSQGRFYKAPRGTLYSRHDPYTPHDFDSDVKERLQANGKVSPIIPNKENDMKPSATNLDSQMSEFEITIDPSEHSNNEWGMSTSSHQCSKSIKHNDLLCDVDPAKILDDFGKEAISLDTSSLVRSEESDLKSENTGGDDPIVKRIVYSSEALKAMNPLNGKTRYSIIIKEPFELKHIFSRMDEKENAPFSCQQHISSSFPYNDPKLGSNKDGCKAYASIPAESSEGNNQRTSLSPANAKDDRGSNYSPISDLISNPEHICQPSNQSLFEKEEWTHDVPVATNNEICIPDVEEYADPNKGKEEVAIKAEWPVNFFRNASVGGKKKKKTKFRPLQDFIGDNMTYGVDESGKEFDNLEEFSEEALQMYIELENEGKERKMAESRVIHGPKPLTSTNSKSRASLFADVRKANSAPQFKPWVPGKRKCTRCGSENHIINDCSEGTINNIDDMSYMF